MEESQTEDTIIDTAVTQNDDPISHNAGFLGKCTTDKKESVSSHNANESNLGGDVGQNVLDEKINKIDNENNPVKISDNSESEIVSLTKETVNASKASDVNPKVLKDNLDQFKHWCSSHNLVSSDKVSLEFRGTSHRYGMVATEDIRKGATLFTIPRNLLLNPAHGTLSKELEDYEIWMDSLGRSMEDSSGWVPLLITLMYEFTKKDSFWAPYLKLIPESAEFGHPLFWEIDEIEDELSGMSLMNDLLEDRRNIEEEYNFFVLPFLMQNKNLSGSLEKFSMDLFKRMVAFVMAYSFTEDKDESPCMIPMADMLNHHSNNNAHLIFQKDCLKMVSCRKVKKGEEIFNTFGKLGNSELLQMYGYTEKDNKYDAFSLYIDSFTDIMECSGRLPSSYIQAMTALLHGSEIVQMYDYFVFDKNGLRRGPDLMQFLKIIHMNESQFEEMLEKRARNPSNSFYQKLLRKLKLAKKTDMSSGVAVIDITDDNEIDEISPSKRKTLGNVYDEREDETTVKRQCLHDDMTTLSGNDSALNRQLHFADAVSYLPTQSMSDLSSEGLQVEGNTSSEPIVIDDDDDDEADDGENLFNDENTNSNENNPVYKKDPDNSIIEKNIDECQTNSERNNRVEENTLITEKNTLETEQEITLEKLEREKNLSSETIINEDENDSQKNGHAAAKDDCNSCSDQHTSNKDQSDKEIEEKTKSTATISENHKNGKLVENTVKIGQEEEEKDEEEEDEDDIEIVGEDVGCILTYDKLKEILLPEWKSTIREVLTESLKGIKEDVEENSENLTRTQYNASLVRKGQKKLIKNFLQSLNQTLG